MVTGTDWSPYMRETYSLNGSKLTPVPIAVTVRPLSVSVTVARSLAFRTTGTTFTTA